MTIQNISLPFLIGFLVLLIVLSGFFSAAETSMMALNRYRLQHFVRQKHRRATLVSRLLEHPDRLLSVVLIGNTFANIAAAAFMTVIAGRLFGDIGIAVASILLTFLILVFGEVMPKTLAALYSRQTAFFMAWPLNVLLRVFYPLVWFINSIVLGFLKCMRIHVRRRVIEPLSHEELGTVLQESSSLTSPEHRSMLLSILNLEKVKVEDVMIPRNELKGIDLAEDWPKILTLLMNMSHTRLLVYRHNYDDILGILNLRHILGLIVSEKLSKQSLLKIIGEPYFIPEGTPLFTQLLNFQSKKQRTAIVVDEYGDLQGLVTLEDILEEIVGEFTSDVSKNVYSQIDGSFLVDGTANIRDLNRLMKWTLPIDGPKTLSGLIIEHLEMIPSPGTCVLLAGYPVEVILVKDNVIKSAKIFPLQRKTIS